MTGTYKTYQIPNDKALAKCKRVIWRGLFNRSEVHDGKKRVLISVNPQGLARIKKYFPLMTIKEVEE